jgi:high frequency lysogenization protein
MSYHNLASRCIAFAAISQAAYLVNKIATTGLCPDVNAFEASLNSILKLESDSPLEIYGGYSGIGLGLKSALEQLDNSTGKRDMQVTKYMIGMMALERKLIEDSATLDLLDERILQVQRQLQHFSISDDSVLRNLDSIYKDLISNLGPKIQVNGTPSCLQQAHNQHKIRALLLAGVRAAVLWRQLGGKRRQLILSRSAMITQMKQDLQRV